MTDTLLQSRGQFYLGKQIDKVEHEGMGTRARIEVSQGADNADKETEMISGSS